MTKKFFLIALITLVMLALSPAQAQNNPAGELNVDTILVIDNSGSMNNNDVQELRLSAAKLFIDLAAIGDRFGIVVMAGPGETRSLTSSLIEIRTPEDQAQLKQLIDEIGPANGNTHMGDALNIAYGLLAESYESASGQRFVLLLTDGQPEPENQYELVDTTMTLFQDRPDWPVYAIALGEDADSSYLKTSISNINGGLTFESQNAESLIEIYLDVYELLLDDRYIDEVTLSDISNPSFLSIDPSLQLNELSLIVQRPIGSPYLIQTLDSPNRYDLVIETDIDGVYSSLDKAYELYKVVKPSDVNVVGRWDIELNNPPGDTQIIALARSSLRTRLFFPASSNFFDERATRYIAADRPFYLNLGAIDGNRKPIPSLSPGINVLNNNIFLAADDMGEGWDFVKADGFHSAYSETALSEGQYTFQLEIPSSREQPLRLKKPYDVTVLELPRLDLFLSTNEDAQALSGFIEGEIFLTPMEEISVEEVRSLTIAIRRPDGVVEFAEAIPENAEISIPPTPDVAPTVQSESASIVPKIDIPTIGRGQSFSGTLFTFKHPINDLIGLYEVYVVADLRAERGDEPVPYIGSSQADFNFKVPKANLRFSNENQITKEQDNETIILLTVQTDTWREEDVDIVASSETSSNIGLSTKRITLKPNEKTQLFEITLFSDDVAGTLGEFDLSFSSPTDSLIIEDDTETLQVTSTAQILVSPASQLIEYDYVNEQEIILTFQSKSNQDETIEIDFKASGIQVDDILPRKIVIPADESKQVTLQLFMGQSDPPEGELILTLTSQRDGIELDNETLVFQIGEFEESGGFSFITIFGLLVAILGSVYLIFRKRLKNF